LGIEGLASFRASFIAASLAEAAPNYFSSVEPREISLPFLKSQASLSPFEIAEALDHEEAVQVLVKKIEHILEQYSATHVLLPPVMGMIHTKEIFKLLEKSCGRTFAETLASRSSVPGWRFSEAILRYFKFRGYDILSGEVVGFEGQNRQIHALKIHAGPERMRLKADKVILAPGKFIGGGIQDRETVLKESIFGLPLFLHGKPIGAWGRRDLFSKGAVEDQPIFSVGLHSNERGQVLDLRSEVPWENLFACGRVLSGCGVRGDRCASAVSLVSGGVMGV
jgi:glycerol-3-phosphate dehydrogenase subunit B